MNRKTMHLMFLKHELVCLTNETALIIDSHPCRDWNFIVIHTMRNLHLCCGVYEGTFNTTLSNLGSLHRRNKLRPSALLVVFTLRFCHQCLFCGDDVLAPELLLVSSSSYQNLNIIWSTCVLFSSHYFLYILCKTLNHDAEVLVR